MSNSERDARAARRNQLREEAAEDGARSEEETDDHLEDDADSSSEEGLVGRRARMVMDAIIRVIPSDPVQQMLNDLVDSEGSTSGDSSSSEEDYQDYLDDHNDGRDADQMMAAANPRRLDDVDEVVVLVNEVVNEVVVVHNGIGIGPLGGQMAMLGPRDYVDGADQMQDVLDQLFHEAGQQAGALPMPAERIQALESEVLEEEVEDMGNCPICVEAFQAGDQIQYPGCLGSRLHGCHPQCLQGWLSRHSTCPVCRQRLGNDGGGEQEQDGGEGQDVGDEELLGMSFDD